MDFEVKYRSQCKLIDELVVEIGNKGTNIRVGIWELGPDDDTNLVIEDRYDSTPSTSSHARLTTGVIKNKEKTNPNGYAPSCKTYSANSYDIDALEWAEYDAKPGEELTIKIRKYSGTDWTYYGIAWTVF